MKKVHLKKIYMGAPYILLAGMGCFVAAYAITNPWIKDTLLLSGLAAVTISVILYVLLWKNNL